MIINNINFEIKDIEFRNDKQQQYYMSGVQRLIPQHNQDGIKIIATTDTKNYMLIEKWFDELFDKNGQSNPAKNYKKDIIYNTIQIIGIMPIDYIFTQNNIEITLSVDYINGDLSLFKIRELRKEKLKKIEECQKYL